MQILLFSGLLPIVVYSLTCYDCYDTGPDHKTCTQQRNCTGKACMIFDAGDGKTLTAFCIMATKHEEEKKSACWMESDGVGKHCICHEDFCNRLDAKQPIAAADDPLTQNVGGAEMLKKNPLVDYEDENEGAAPAPANVLFPGAEAADPQTTGDDDDDLVPISFEDYENKEKLTERDSNEQRRLETNQIGDVSPTDADVSSAPQPPKCVLIFLTMAASMARFFAGI
ncbi:unnamed protein product, partial [Mesorhabditis belari]|uniref:Uncharacterized protein n=1 Tax=Mesorhabditis belari TaxID=2138241 RepID=A0AAF3FUF4_9BILA